MDLCCGAEIFLKLGKIHRCYLGLLHFGIRSLGGGVIGNYALHKGEVDNGRWDCVGPDLRKLYHWGHGGKNRINQSLANRVA